MDSDYSILAIIISAGFFGGLINYSNTPKDQDVPFLKGNFFKSISVGVAAATLMPVFLQMISSNLITQFDGGDKSKFILFGFSLIAAISSRSFIDNISRKILNQLRETNAKVDEIEVESRHDKKDIAYLMAENLMVRGKLNRAEGAHEEALKMFEEAIKIESSDRAWGLKALQHFYLKQYDEALKANSKALLLERSGDTQDYQLHWNQACFLSLLEREVDEIMQHIDQALKLRPELKAKIATEAEFEFARRNKMFREKYNIDFIEGKPVK